MSELGSRIKIIIDSVRATGRYKDDEHSSSGMAIFLSVVAATMIWFMISMRESYSVVRDFPVVVVNVPPDTALQQYPPPSVRVHVEGTGWQLLKLYTAPSPIRLDAGQGTIDLLRATATSLAPDLIPRSVNPVVVTLALEERGRKKVPIRVRWDIETIPPFDLVRDIRAQPDSVVVTGATSILARLDYWPTEVLVRDRVNASFTSSVGLSDTLSGLVNLSLVQVAAVAEVAEFTEHRRMLEVSVTDAPQGVSRFRLIPDQVEVRYRIPIQQFEAAALTDSFYAVVPYADILSDTTGRVSPTVRVPRNLVVRDLTLETPRLQYYVILD